MKDQEHKNFVYTHYTTLHAFTVRILIYMNMFSIAVGALLLTLGAKFGLLCCFSWYLGGSTSNIK